MTAPAVGSLETTYKKVAFSFAIPTIVFLGSLYSVCSLNSSCLSKTNHFDTQSVTARFIFFRIFENSRHRHSNTALGWGVWAGIIACTWILAFIISQVIPFFSDMLSLMSSLFGTCSVCPVCLQILPKRRHTRDGNPGTDALLQMVGLASSFGPWHISPYTLAKQNGLVLCGVSRRS